MCVYVCELLLLVFALLFSYLNWRAKNCRWQQLCFCMYFFFCFFSFHFQISLSLSHSLTLLLQCCVTLMDFPNKSMSWQKTEKEWTVKINSTLPLLNFFFFPFPLCFCKRAGIAGKKNETTITTTEEKHKAYRVITY